MEKRVESMQSIDYDTMLSMLAELREAKGVSQRDLSRRLGRDFTFVNKIEAGSRRLDPIELIEICKELGHSPSAFLEAVDQSISKGHRNRA